MFSNLPKFSSTSVLLIGLLALSGCQTTHNWLESIMRPDTDDIVEIRNYKDDPPPAPQMVDAMDVDHPSALPHTSHPMDMDANFEKLRRASLGYYGGIRNTPHVQYNNAISTPSSLNPSVEVFQIDGSYAPGTVLSQNDFATPAAGSYHYQSMFPELGGTNPFGAQPTTSERSSGDGSTALAPVYGGPDGQSSIFFKHGSSYIGSGDRGVLSKVAQDAQESSAPLKIDAYASQRTALSDPVAAAQVNLKQSLDRAYAVSQTLIQEGVPLEKIQTSTWGDTKLSGRGEAYDRRVDITNGETAGGQ